MRTLLFLLLVLAMGAIPCGCSEGNATVGPPPNLTVFYTADTRGHIEPCNCVGGMAGGLSRRKAYVDSVRIENALLLDAGDVAAGPREWERFEAEFILEGYSLMGYHAVNLGRREISTGVEGIGQFRTKYDAFVSANVLDSQTRKPIVDPYRIVQLPQRSRVAVIGVADDTIPPEDLGEGLVVIPPEDAITQYLDEMRRKADVCVLLAFAGEETMKSLAERFPEFDLILGGDVAQPSGTPQRVNRSLIAYITDKGKAIGRLDLVHDAQGFQMRQNKIQMLESETERDAQIDALIDRYKDELSLRAAPVHADDEEHLTSIISSSRAASADRYAGSSSCRECHPKAYEIWAASKLAQGYRSLELERNQHNPRCLTCHTVGYGASDGFTRHEETPDLAAVGCESCHGRGDYHNRLMKSETIPAQRIFLAKTTDCVKCHDPDNSPMFDQTTYWEKIKHGNE